MDDQTKQERNRCVACVMSQMDTANSAEAQSLLIRIVNLIESGETNPSPFGETPTSELIERYRKNG